MAEYLIDKAYLVALADAIRSKSGSSSKMTPSAMVSAINNLGDMTYTPQSSSTVINKTGELYTIQDTTFNSLANAIRNKAGISDKMTPHKMIDVVNGLNSAQAFAVFSADDNSLNFYKRLNVPKVGERFEGKTATKIYTGIETLEIDRASAAPWHYDMIESVKVVDRISPISTASWFRIFNSSGGGSNRSYQNKGHSTIRSIDIKNLDTSKVKDMSWMFYYCDSIEQIDLSGFNTSKVTNMYNMFFYCRSLTTMNLSMFDTSNVADMGSMFYGCTRLSNLDLSGWDTSSVTSVTGMIDMFQSCEKLQQVKFGDRFMWSGTNGYLPTQKSTYIPNADGKWYAASDGKGYAPADIPSNKADTYYAYPPQAFAVYSDDDKSLNFYKRFSVPKAGERFDGRTVTEMYIGFEANNNRVNPPWYKRRDSIANSKIVDVIRPKNTSSWFQGCYNLQSIDILNLDTTEVVDMYHMFDGCSSITTIDVSNFNTSNVTNMDYMFYGCSSLISLDASSFDTKNVNSMICMFSYCTKLINLDVSGFHTPKLVDCVSMFSGCVSITFLDLSNFDTSHIQYKYMGMYNTFFDCNHLEKVILGDKVEWETEIDYDDCWLPSPSSRYVPNADGNWYAKSDGKGYRAKYIPSNKADTYYASKNLLP